MTTATAEPVAVKERPIVCSALEVRAFLDGTKSQVRRVVKPQPVKEWSSPIACCRYYPTVIDRKGDEGPGDAVYGFADEDEGRVSPFGKPGDRLWVRETFSDPFRLDVKCKNFTGFFKATDPGRKVKWESPLSMPRWASRITLEVTGVRVERLQDISEEDAKAEGARRSVWGPHDRWYGAKPRLGFAADYRHGFFNLWESIYGTELFDLNPYVWVGTLKRC
jgi:hypothetical protein